MAITARAVGAWTATTTRNPTVTLPTHAAGDMLLVRIGWKSATPTTDVAVCNTSGWTKLGQFYDGGGASSNGGGGVLVAVFYKEAASAAETNPVVEFDDATAPTPGAYLAVSYQKGAGESWVTPVGAGGGFASSTAISATIGTHISTTSGDLVDAFTVGNDNNTMTVPTFTQAGVTFNTVTEYPATALSSATSNDIEADGCYRIATAGTSSAAAVVTGTLNIADSGAAWTTRLRVVTVTSVSPDPVALPLAVTTPVVTAGRIVSPDPVALPLLVTTPVVTVGVLVSPAPVAVSLAVPIPTVTAEAAPTVVSPDPVPLTLAVPTSTVQVGARVAPDPVAVSLQVAVPVVSSGVIVAPGPSAAVLVALGGTVSVGVIVTPDPVAVSLQVVPVSVLVGVLASPSPVAMVLDVPIPTVQVSGSTSVAPDPVALSLDVPIPVLQVGRVLTPDPVPVVLEAPGGSLEVGVLLTPDPVVLALEVVAGLVEVGISLAPDPVLLLLDVPVPIVQVGGSVTISPDPVVLDLAVPVPTVTAGGAGTGVTVYPAPVAVVLTVGDWLIIAPIRRPGSGGIADGPTLGTTIRDQGRSGGGASDQERMTVGVRDG